MEQASSLPSPCGCGAAVRELQQEVRALREELACHVSCRHCGLLYDKRCVMPAGACAATGSATHDDPEFERCAVCRLVVPKAAPSLFRMSDFLDGVESRASLSSQDCCCGGGPRSALAMLWSERRWSEGMRQSALQGAP